MRLSMCIAVGLLIVAPGWSVAGADDKEVMLSISAIARENSNKFPFGALTFSFQDGFSGNSDEARRGHLTDTAPAMGSYRYDDRGRAFHELRFAPDVLQRVESHDQNGTTSSRVHSRQTATNGKLTLRETFFSQPMRSNGLGSGVAFDVGHQMFYTGLEIPMHLGYPSEQQGDVERVLQKAALGHEGFRLVRMDLNATREGRPNAYFVIEMPTQTAEFWIDLERGATVSYGRARNHADQSLIEMINDRVEFIPNHGWLPLIQTVNIGQNRYNRTVIDKYDFETKPDTDAFTMRLLHAQPLIHPITRAEMPPAQSYNLDRLPADFLRTPPIPPGVVAARGSQSPATPSATTSIAALGPLAGELSQPPTSRWGLLLLLGMSGVVGLILWSRLRGRRL